MTDIVFLDANGESALRSEGWTFYRVRGALFGKPTTDGWSCLVMATTKLVSAEEMGALDSLGLADGSDLRARVMANPPFLAKLSQQARLVPTPDGTGLILTVEVDDPCISGG